MRTQRPTKERYRSLFLALQADAKEYPGGIRAMAEVMGLNGGTLSNGVNPDHEALPPSFAVILELITLCQAKRTVFALAQLVNQIPMDLDIDHATEAESMQRMFTLIHQSGAMLQQASEHMRDGRIDQNERRQLEPVLYRLLQATAEMIRSIR